MPATDVRIRTATHSDFAAIAAVERAAWQLFLEWQDRLTLDDGEPTEPEEIFEAIDRGDLFVAARADDVPIGFAHMDVVDGQAHLFELDVDPAHGRQGIGRALVDHVAETSRGRGHAALTLTTFREVPWNRAFYETAGFEMTERYGPEMETVVAKERGMGLDFSERCVMRRVL